MRPDREVWGVTLSYHHDLSSFIDNAWFSIMLPFIEAHHDLHFKETIESTTFDPSSFLTIGEALNNPDWVYGKWRTKGLSKTGLDDVLFKIGYGVFRWNRLRLELYVSFLIPVNEAQTAECVFEPMVGNGDHFQVGGGLNFEAEFVKSKHHGLSLLLDVDYRYGFSGTEKRSFDIMGKPWARYMNYQEENKTVADIRPGINFFTRELDVRPESSLDLWAALHYRYSVFNIETGYSFWWKTKESVSLKEPWPFDMSISAQASNTFFPSALISDAWGIPDPAEVFTKVKQSDLDLSSAEHKSASSHTIYGALSASGQLSNHPSQIGIGGSYEFASENTALSVWGIWLQASVGF